MSSFDQMELSRHAETISSRLRFFSELDEIVRRLGSPTLSVHDDSFVPTLAKLDQCIGYMQAHVRLSPCSCCVFGFYAFAVW